MRKIKKHIGAIILLIIVLVFPTSLSNQAKLNMRIIVTGLAVDKVGDDYEVTAQIVKTSPGSKSGGADAQVDFITDKAPLLSAAVAKLAYKAGKVSAFSHTNYVILGKSMLEENLSASLDYFIRDKIIKNSALILFSEDSAKDEIKKTKNTELSVGIGLQKVFLFKEYESDGIMMTMMDFLNDNKWYAKTAIASTVSLKPNDEKSESSLSGSSSESSGDGGATSGSGSGSGEGESGGSSKSESQFFEAFSPIVCFVEGKFAGKLKTDDEITGYMLANKKARAVDIDLIAESEGILFGKKMEINIKNMRNSYKLRYEGNTPCLDVCININNSEINEIITDDIIGTLSDKEFEGVKTDLSNEISKRVSACFVKAKSFGADVFDAYELAYKFHYKKTTENFKTTDDFLKNLKLNVQVTVHKLDY